MVKNRGIEISIISQFDIRRLPEFQGPVPTKEAENERSRDNLATCYVPIYPGSQIWFEYTIEPPHPPKAVYFFKLLINQQVITSWDSSEKHGYHGKTMYALQKISANNQQKAELHQRGFQFCNHNQCDCAGGESNDCIEIRVHRVAHRQRIRDILITGDKDYQESAGPLRFVDHGPLGPERPQRRYKYQLLDPADEPYAVFQLFYRTCDFLNKNNIFRALRLSSSSMMRSSMISSSTSSSSIADDIVHGVHTGQPSHAGEVRTEHPSTPRKQVMSRVIDKSLPSSALLQSCSFSSYISLSDSENSLNNIAKDSVEDLPSTVTQSPPSPRSNRFGLWRGCQRVGLPIAEPKSLRKKLKSKLTLSLHPGETKSEKVKRASSPFAGVGLLQRILNSRPSSSMAQSNDVSY